MLFLVAVLTTGYFAAVVWLRRDARQRARPAQPLTLPAADLPPGTAVGWPPLGSAFPEYVDDGIAALHAYLSEGFTA